MINLKYVQTPNLPIHADTVIVSECITREMADSLKRFGCGILYAPNIPMAFEGISDHPDCRIAHMGGNVFIAAPDAAQYYKNLLPDANLIQGISPVGGNYPGDAAYNIAWIGNRAMHNIKCTDARAAEFIGGKIINTKQGYSKCSTCIVDENSIITEDISISRAAEKAGIDVLKIQYGGVRLRGADYGFIGGCCGKLRRDLLAFFGDVSAHPEYERIFSFCTRRGVTPVSLSRCPLTDFGSILPICEKE